MRFHITVKIKCYLTIIHRIIECSPRQSRGEYSPMFTEPEANNCFRIIFRGEYQELLNSGLKH